LVVDLDLRVIQRIRSRTMLGSSFRNVSGRRFNKAVAGRLKILLAYFKLLPEQVRLIIGQLSASKFYLGLSPGFMGV